MLRLLIVRLLAAVPVLLVVSLVSFGLTLLVPGDIAAEIAGPTASKSDVDHVREELGLNKPPLERMIQWYGGVLHGDLGRSISLNQGVGEAVLQRLPVTLSLTFVALTIACLLGIPAGLIAAAKARAWPDQAAMGAALIGLSLPDFWLGLLLIWLFGVKLGWLPTGGFVAPGTDLLGWLRSITLPAGALALTQLGPIARMTRAAALEVANSDYIRTARAKGLTATKALWRHAVPNALIPVVTIIGLQFSFLLAGTVIIENVFTLPGLGRLMFQSIAQRDLIVVQDLVVLLAGSVIVVNFAVDLVYMLLDPRIAAR